MKRPRGCSIIVPVFNHASLTRQCIATVLATPAAGMPTEIIVVDDGSRDLTRRVLSAYAGRIKTLTHQANLGFATACNDGAELATFDHLVFLNNDTVPRSGWLAHLLEYALDRPNVGVVGAKLLYADDTIQHAGMVFNSEKLPIPIYRGLSDTEPAVNRSRRYPAVTGACMLVRRQLFERVGGFDPVFINGFEDVDLCLRIGELGLETHYCHSAVLTHLESSTRGAGGFVDQRIGERTDEANRRLFLARWSRKVEHDEHHYYVQDGLLAIEPSLTHPKAVRMSPHLQPIVGDAELREQDRLFRELNARAAALTAENHRLVSLISSVEVAALASRSAGDPLPSLAELRDRANLFDVRAFVAACYLKGAGVEIGASDAPLQLPPGVTAVSVDITRRPLPPSRFPNTAIPAPLPIDHVGTLDDMPSIEDQSMDFAVANHVLEHCENPIGAIEELLRVVRVGGIVYLAIPDKRHTFDHARDVTTLQHLIDDHRRGPGRPRGEHFVDFAKHVPVSVDMVTAPSRALDLMERDVPIHFHAWSPAEILELLAYCQRAGSIPFDVELTMQNHIEMIVVLRRLGQAETSAAT
jgi:GT2 family glycosyltransferase